MHYLAHGNRYALVGECGYGREPYDEAEYRANLQMGLAFLQQRLPPPPLGCVLEIIEAQYTSPYLVIALRLTDAAAHGEGLAQAQAFADLAQVSVWRFHDALDWNRISPEALRGESRITYPPKGPKIPTDRE